MSTEPRSQGLARLDALVGTWDIEMVFPSDPPGTITGAQTTFDWMTGNRLLVQRTDIPDPDAPSSLIVYEYEADADTYRQHYFDSRGVIRVYAMTLTDDTWTLLRDQPDFSALEFSQRFTATFEDGGDTIRGVWEIALDHETWAKDFDLFYRRAV